ncbi:hypothetical protein [Jatrophihabitans sp.]|uniref:hypothetical protein n=1 Tax=Jatrophihabitans sp. TaxID=1932789 RepID=UPI002B5EA277|nr:hypothetical protein [Jatrophihabitans sp.]
MSRPAPSRKHKIEESESESEDESETEELAPARSVALSGLAVKKPRKSESERLAESSGLDFDPGLGGFSIGSGGRSAKEKSGLANRDRRTERQRGGPKPVAVRPHYQPVTDKYGRKLWKGSRAGLDWFANVKSAMDTVDDGTCKIVRDAGCTGVSEGIDHVKDFATEQTGLATELICDGRHHWKAILLSEAKQLYNGGFDDEEDIAADGDAMTRLQKAFVWSCTHCNSGKSGGKGRDGGQAIWQEACPGEDDCPL